MARLSDEEATRPRRSRSARPQGVFPEMTTYKKEEVKRIFYGDARIVVLILQGHPFPGTNR
jgi:hypothetical protein